MFEFVACTVLLGCHASTRGNPVIGITPPSFACSAHPHFRSLRHLDELSDHRDVAVDPFPFRRRGTISLPPWRQMSQIMLMSTFSSNCLKHAYVIRIMITTFKCLKLCLHLNCYMHMGIFRTCCLLFPASFKLA